MVCFSSLLWIFFVAIIKHNTSDVKRIYRQVRSLFSREKSTSPFIIEVNIMKKKKLYEVVVSILLNMVAMMSNFIDHCLEYNM